MRFDVHLTQEFFRTVENIEATNEIEAIKIAEDTIASTRYNPAYFDEPTEADSIYIVESKNGTKYFTGDEVL